MRYAGGFNIPGAAGNLAMSIAARLFNRNHHILLQHTAEY